MDPYSFAPPRIDFQMRHAFMGLPYIDHMELPKGWRSRLRELWRLYTQNLGQYDFDEGRFMCVLAGKHVKVWSRDGVRCSRCGKSRAKDKMHMLVTGLT